MQEYSDRAEALAAVGLGAKALVDLGLAPDDSLESRSLPRWWPKQTRGSHSPALAQRTSSDRLAGPAADASFAMAKRQSQRGPHGLSQLVQSGRRIRTLRALALASKRQCRAGSVR